MLQSCVKVVAGLLIGIFSIALLGLGGVALANGWIHWSATRYVHNTIEDVPARDVAIVPGTGMRHDGEIGGYFLPRLLAGLNLYRAHKVRAILVSGVGGAATDGNEVSSAERWLLERGVRPADIILDHAGFRTLDTMQRARHAFHVESAIVCSQDYFLTRAVFLARAAGMDAEGFLTLAFPGRDDYAIRLETAKTTLAFIDTYILHRGPRLSAPPAVLAQDP